MKTINNSAAAIRRIKLGALFCLAGLFFVVMIGGGRYFLGVQSIAKSSPPQTNAAFTNPIPNQTPSPLPTPLPPTISPIPPTDTAPLPSGIPFQFFDDFSWRAFVALVWPAQQGQRGVPDTTKTVGDAGPLVFETYKADWEVFQPNGAQPSEWNDYSGQNLCQNSVTPKFGDLILVSTSKFSNLGQATQTLGRLTGPLVAQNMTYVRFQTAFDNTEYTQIRNNGLYLRSNLGGQNGKPPVTFPDGAIDVKSAWLDMTGIQNPERFHTRSAYVYDPDSGQCTPKTMGLVGLHIVVKTPTRPQWIWASFEQIDNIPQNGAQAPYNFNDGSGTLMPRTNPINYPPPAPTPTQKFNVTRTRPINASTVQTNAAYQQVLKTKGSGVWQYYQLVMTQWPTPGKTPGNSGAPPFTIPGCNPNNPPLPCGNQNPGTAFSNITMETFDQTALSTSCMACHSNAQTQSDFVWTIYNHAYPSAIPERMFGEIRTASSAGNLSLANTRRPISPALKKLETLLAGSTSRPAEAVVKPKPPAGKPNPVKKQPPKPVKKSR